MFHPFVEYQQQWFYRIYPQTTSKMISLSHSKDILFVVDLGQLEPFVGIIFDTTDSMCNVCIFRNVKEVLVRDVNTPPPPPTPPDDHTTACATCASSVTWRKCSSRTLIHPPTPLMIIRQHVQHVKNSKKIKSYTPISASLIFEICNPSKGS